MAVVSGMPSLSVVMRLMSVGPQGHRPGRLDFAHCVKLGSALRRVRRVGRLLTGWTSVETAFSSSPVDGYARLRDGSPLVRPLCCSLTMQVAVETCDCGHSLFTCNLTSLVYEINRPRRRQLRPA